MLMRDEAVAALKELGEVIERLRQPDGCPWDREQTARTLRPFLLEETYEVLEAIESGNADMLREELGDLLLQIVMQSVIASESAGGFDIGDVAETTRKKMIYRHPHVFGDAAVSGAADVVVKWEKLKEKEKHERTSLLDGVPVSLPALARAEGVQKRPARLGFDQAHDPTSALAYVRDALERVAQRADHADGRAQGEDWSKENGEGAGRDVGALLFAVVALARHLGVNGEDALRQETEVFIARFRALEKRARTEGVDLHELPVGEWQRRWEGTE